MKVFGYRLIKEKEYARFKRIEKSHRELREAVNWMGEFPAFRVFQNAVRDGKIGWAYLETLRESMRNATNRGAGK